MLRRPTVLSQALGIIFAGIALFAVQWMNIPYPASLVPVPAALSAIVLTIAWRKGDAARALLARRLQFLPLSPGLGWLAGTILLGISLRVLVAFVFPASLVSDSQRYFELATRLAAGQDYADTAGRAFWPPGLPIALAVLMVVFGSYSVLLYDVITFALTAIITFALGTKLANRRAGLLAAFLIAVWPNFVLAAPILLKECLLVLLWPTAIFFYLSASEDISEARASFFALLAGVAIGYAALTQPSHAFLGGCFVLFSWVTIGWRRRTAICLAFAAFGAIAVVTPWTIRNYAVLHRFVPIATAGGVNFFMVTQPSSDGRWNANYDTPEATSQLTSDELKRNERGFILGIKSIRGHPVHFFGTVIRKPFYIFGQDVKSSYFVFERGGVGSSTQYAVSYWISNGFYMVVIMLITVFVMQKNYVRDTSPALILPWLFVIYPIFAHSLFEASERHRYGALSIMAIFAAMAACPPSYSTRLDGRPLVHVRA